MFAVRDSDEDAVVFERPATINMYKLERKDTYLYSDVLTKHLPASTRPLLPKLLAFGMTLHRLKFPSSDRYISEVSSSCNSSDFVICLTTISKSLLGFRLIIRPFLPALFAKHFCNVAVL